MASSEIDIANLALSHLAVGTEISSFTERSQEAIALSRLYEQTRDEVLRDFPWPFATAITDLALVEEDPNIEWAYAYRFPTDCVRFRRILNGASRIETPQTRVPYRIGRDAEGGLILTDQREAQGEYTVKVTDPTQYPSDFTQALALLLAYYVAPKVTGGDQFKLGERALQTYNWRMLSARGNALNEEQADLITGSELERARDA